MNESDHMNRHLARIRNDPEPDKFEISRKLCQQYIDNHAKSSNLAHNEFSPDKPHCFMTSDNLAKLSSM
jgi:hypothetical protein